MEKARASLTCCASQVPDPLGFRGCCAVCNSAQRRQEGPQKGKRQSSLIVVASCSRYEADGKSGDAAGSKAEATPAKIALSRMLAAYRKLQ